MSAALRPDILEYQRLSSIVNLSAMPFDKAVRLMLKFLIAELPQLSVKFNLVIDAELLVKIRSCLDVAHRVLTGKLKPFALVEPRVILWELHDQQPANSDARNLARLAVCGLYDKDSAEYSTYGSEPMFGAFFSALMDLRPDYCCLFTEYATREMTKRNPRAR